MQCLSPILIKNPNFGKIPNVYQYIKVPCGKCEACAINQQSQWFQRLLEEQKVSSCSYFVTLTYDDEHLPEDGNLSKYDLQCFFKRLRKKVKNIKYYVLGEYGGETYRCHYHFIIFCKSYYKFEFLEDVIFKTWKKGFITLDKVNNNRLKYVSGYYISKMFAPDGKVPCFTLMSKGLGSNYILSHKTFHKSLENLYYSNYGHHMPLCRYYKERLYNESDRYAYSLKCQQIADDKYTKDLEAANNDVNRVEQLYYQQRADFARRIHKYHKKTIL